MLLHKQWVCGEVHERLWKNPARRAAA